MAARLSITPTTPPSPICIVGAGYVGLVTAVCLAEGGVQVRLLDVDRERLEQLRGGRSPIHEPMLDELLVGVLANERLTLHDSAHEAIKGAQVVMVAVGTPPLADGRADLSQVRAALTNAVAHASPDAIMVIKSTVPPGTTAAMRAICRRNGRRFPLAVCPEFLSEGSAVRDFNHPPQVVIGGDDPASCERVAALFSHLDAPIIITDSTSAELIKYGVNAFLALKISFINEMAHLCELVSADIMSVADGIGADPRIGRAFLGAGLGFGGSCFPKDVRALDQAASYHGQSFWLLRAAVEVNAQQRTRFVAKIQDALNDRINGKRIAVLGLAFKPGTDDVRAAASIDVIKHLEDLGARVTATDPVATLSASRHLPLTRLVRDPYECVKDADAVVVVTEWPEYRDLDWHHVAELVKRRLVVDGRNCLDADQVVAAGFTYLSIGQQVRRPQTVRRSRATDLKTPQVITGTHG